MTQRCCQQPTFKSDRNPRLSPSVFWLKHRPMKRSVCQSSWRSTAIVASRRASVSFDHGMSIRLTVWPRRKQDEGEVSVGAAQTFLPKTFQESCVFF